MQSARIRQLDMLRFIAMFMVLGRHLKPAPDEVGPSMGIFADFWRNGGWAGVDLFFVLSGFLVSGLLFREYQRTGTADVKRFLIRRGFKIYPALWVLIIVTVAVRLATNVEIQKHDVLGEVFFLQNYVGRLWGQTWSLAVEEHFYILLAILVVYLVGRSKADAFRLIPIIFIFVAAACFCARLLATQNSFYSHETHLYPTQLRLDALFFGVLISYYWHFRDLGKNEFLIRHSRILILAGILFFLPAFAFEIETTPWMTPVGLTLTYIGGGLVLVGFLLSDLKDRYVWTAMAFVGTYSYSIYLWHVAVETWGGRWIESLVPQGWYYYVVFYFVVSIVIGIVMGKIVEVPMLNLRDRYFPSKTQVVPLP